MRGHVLLVGVLLPMLAGCLAPAEPLGTTGLAGLTPPTLPSLLPFAPVVALRDAIRAALVTGEAVELQAARVLPYLFVVGTVAGPQPFKVVLRASDLVAQDAWAEVEGRPVALPPFEVYEGHVEGESDQHVRLVITDGWARGAIRVDDQTYVIRMGLNGNLPYGVAPPPRPSSGLRAPEISAEDLQFDPVGWLDELECIRAVPSEFRPVLAAGARPSDLVADIILDGDAVFAQAAGPHAFPLLAAMLGEVDLIFEDELALRFRVVGLHLHQDPGRFDSPLNATPLVNLSAYWNERLDKPRDVVHLVTGQRSNYAQANCIGGAGDPEVAYTFTPLGWDERDAVWHTNAFAHELGHIFSAHHHYGNHAETGSDGATLMVQGYTHGLRQVFSTLSKSVMRGWAEAHVGPASSLPLDEPRMPSDAPGSPAPRS